MVMQQTCVRTASQGVGSELRSEGHQQGSGNKLVFQKQKEGVRKCGDGQGMKAAGRESGLVLFSA